MSLLLSLQKLHDGQNHYFLKLATEMELLTFSAMGTDTMSSFSSLTAEATVECNSSSQGVTE